MIVQTWDRGPYDEFGRAVKVLGSGGALKAGARALNHTGMRTRTKVVRAVKEQTGLSSIAAVKQYGGIAVTRATRATPEFVIRSSGREISLKHFRPTQIKKGTKASPWGNRRMFPGLFIHAGYPKSGIFVGGGHVFRNTRGMNPRSGRNNAVEMTFGPSVPKEIVQGQTAAVFAAQTPVLAKRMAHEIGVITKGVVS